MLGDLPVVETGQCLFTDVFVKDFLLSNWLNDVEGKAIGVIIFRDLGFNC